MKRRYPIEEEIEMLKNKFLNLRIIFFCGILLISSLTFGENKATSLLFVQTAQAGNLIPIQGKKDYFTLTLKNIAPVTIYFSDRPKRISGQIEMGKFIQEVFKSMKNDPPNATIEIFEGRASEDVLIIELMNGTYDKAKKELVYEVRILKDKKQINGLAHYLSRNDAKLPEKFGVVGVFIDDDEDEHICGEELF